jgi:predicted RNA binding protein YcfA (HicA-like mRNA interferase family)
MSPKLPHITSLQLVRALKRDGWLPARQSGSHMTMRHQIKKGNVIVPIHPGVTIKSGTLKSILKQAGLELNDFLDLL